MIFLEFYVRLLNVRVLELERVLPSPTIHGFRGFGLKASYFTKYIISALPHSLPPLLFETESLALLGAHGCEQAKWPAGPSND